jgi:hypothetical protein
MNFRSWMIVFNPREKLRQLREAADTVDNMGSIPF